MIRSRSLKYSAGGGRIHGRSMVFMLIVSALLFCSPAGGTVGKTGSSPAIQIPTVERIDNMTGYMKHEADQMRQDLKHRADSLFVQIPLGWNMSTLEDALRQAVMLPTRIPGLMAHIREQSRLLGVAGSGVMLVFLMAVGYSLLWRKRVLQKAEALARPLIEKLPEEFQPYIYLVLVSVTAALIPLVLLGFFSLVKEMIAYDAPWFILLGRFFGLWSVGALLISVISGIVDRGILEIRSEYAGAVVRLLRRVILYILAGKGGLWSAEALGFPADFLSLLHFIIYLSFVGALFLFFLRRKLVLSLLPKLPYASFQRFLSILSRYYYPAIVLTFLSGILWCFGYKNFSRALWIKTWAIAGIYVGFSVVYHMLMVRLQKWSDELEHSDEKPAVLIQSLKFLTRYITIIVAGFIMLKLLGVLEPIHKIMSFPMMRIGESTLSLWVMLKAGLMVAAFYYASRLLCAYLNYRVYPSIGVETGLAYAIDTFLKYFLLFMGIMVSLQIVGFDLRSLMVFAGAIGIGIGLAMQNLASSLISGFVIIFGGKIRKGDWLEVNGTLGEVTDIYLRETNLRTNDNIEFIIPNSVLIANTIINYSLKSPVIRIRVPFGVSYAADPHAVSSLALSVAEKEPLVKKSKKPSVWIMGYGDNAINFDLLVWIDVRKEPADHVRSRLYFALFDAFKDAGIEIPFPQRDLHIRTGLLKQIAVPEN